MKFGKTVSEYVASNPQHRDYVIDFCHLKKFLKKSNIQPEAFREALQAESKRLMSYFAKESDAEIARGVDMVVHAASAKGLPPGWIDTKTVEPAFLSQYRALHALVELGDANHTGFRKIVKKYKKLTGLSDMDGLYRSVEEALGDLAKIERLLAEIESAYADIFCNQDLTLACKTLKPITRRPSMFERFSSNVAKFSKPDFLAAAATNNHKR